MPPTGTVRKTKLGMDSPLNRCCNWMELVCLMDREFNAGAAEVRQEGVQGEGGPNMNVQFSC